MKNYIKYIIWSLSLICFSASYAQKMPIDEQRLFNLSIYNAMEDYEKYGDLFDEREGRYFKLIFASGTVMVYNDLLGLSLEKSMNVDQYMEKLTDEAELVDISIDSVQFGSIYSDGNIWKIDVTFNKKMSYYNNGGIRLSSMVYYGAEYNMCATFAWDSQSKRAKMVALDGKVDSEVEPLPLEYFAIERAYVVDKEGNKELDNRDLEVLCNGKNLKFVDVYNQAVLPYSIKKTKFVYPYDNDINLKPVKVQDMNSIYYLKYRPTHWRTKLHYEFCLQDHYNIQLATDNINATSSSNEFAVDFGYVFPSSTKLKTGLFLGVGASMNNIKFNSESFDYSTETDGNADIDGDKYTRYYALKGVKQEFSTVDLVVPFYVDLEYRFSNWFSMYMDLGAKAYLNIDATMDKFEGKYSTYGVYSKYDNLKLDERSGINGFTDNGVLNEENLINEFIPESFSIDAFGSLGFRATIVKGLQFNCGVSYQMGLNDYVAPYDNTVDGSNILENALINYTAADNKENVRNLVEATTSIKRQSLKLNVGLILKF